MLMKTFVSLVALFTLQASASVVTLVARSSLEILASRQTTGACTAVCAPFTSAVDTCTTKACLCTTSVASSLQDCINCAVSNSPTTTVISAAQSLIDTYKSTCAGVISPVLTVPADVPSATPSTTPTSPTSTSRIVVTPTPTSTTSRKIVTAVTTTTPLISQTVISPSDSTDLTDTSTGAATGGLPTGIIKSSSSKTNIQKTFVVAVGAMVGAALVL